MRDLRSAVFGTMSNVEIVREALNSRMTVQQYVAESLRIAVEQGLEEQDDDFAELCNSIEVWHIVPASSPNEWGAAGDYIANMFETQEAAEAEIEGLRACGQDFDIEWVVEEETFKASMRARLRHRMGR